MKEDKRLKNLVVGVLRRASYKWGPRSECRKRARFARGRYRCAMCLGTQFKQGETVVDHIDPVIDPAVGWTSWDDYIKRLFCPLEGLQVLCKECHDKKTKAENQMRTLKTH